MIIILCTSSSCHPLYLFILSSFVPLHLVEDDEKGKWVDSVRRQEGKDAVSEERVGGEKKEEKTEGGEEEEGENEDSKEVEEDKGLEEDEEIESEDEGNLQGEDTDPSSSDTDDDGPCSEVQDNIVSL